MVSARWFGLWARGSRAALSVLALLLVPSAASADDPPAAVVQRRVEKGLLEPLAQKEKERSRFSRLRMPPQERRVRVTQASVSIDASGRAYMAFAVDVRRGNEWHENDVVGCGYTQTGALFVKRGDEYRPAEILLGKDVDVAPSVCTPAKARS